MARDLPIPGVTPGPEWATKLNAAVTAIDDDATSGIAAINAALPGKALIPDNLQRAVGKGELVFNVKDYGAKGDSSGNDSAAIQACIDACAVKGGSVLFPPGTYRAEGIVVPNFVTLRGSGIGSRYAKDNGTVNGGMRSSTTIVRPGSFPSSSNVPVVTLEGSASGMEFIELSGFGGPGTILVTNGFENYIYFIRVSGSTNIGMDIQKADNTRWGGIFVSDCGSATSPAVKIWSKNGAGGVANETNSLTIYSLQIENSGGTSLEVGVGPDSTEYWAEWVRIYDLHIENAENVNQHFHTPNPQVHLGNVRAFEVYGYTLYGGEGPIVRHNQQATRSYGNGGVRFSNGTMLGLDTNPIGNPSGITTPVAIDLVAGDDFKVDGGRFNRFTNQVVSASATYGKYQITRAYSDVQIQPKPGVSGGTGVTAASTLNGSVDTYGRVFWTTGASPAVGVQVQVNMYHKVGTAVCVATPTNAATAAIGLYTAMAADGANFTIRAANVPAASTAMQADYVVTQFAGPF